MNVPLCCTEVALLARAVRDAGSCNQTFTLFQEIEVLEVLNDSVEMLHLSPGDFVLVQTANNEGMCGYHLWPGSEYLLYLEQPFNISNVHMLHRAGDEQDVLAPASGPSGDQCKLQAELKTGLCVGNYRSPSTAMIERARLICGHGETGKSAGLTVQLDVPTALALASLLLMVVLRVADL